MSRETSLYEAWERVLKQEELDPVAAKELGGFRLGFKGEHGQFLAFAGAEEEHDRARFFAIAPFVVATDHREATALLLTRLNFGLPHGCFELDLDDGELRFRDTASFGDREADDEALARLMWRCVAAMDQHLPALVAAAQQGLSPQAAVALLSDA